LITGDDAQSGFVPDKPNYIIIYIYVKDVLTQRDRRGAQLICTTNTVLKCTSVIDLNVQRSPEQRKLVKQCCKGYIPHVLVLDAHGEALYNQSGEVDSEHIEDIFKNSLGHGH
jgi:hypothetical protein